MIYINGRFLGKKMVGVVRYAAEVLKCFDKEENKDKIEILVAKNIPDKYFPKHLKVRKIGKLKGNLWEQISLPNYLRKQKDAKLLNLCNASPLSFKGFTVVHDISFIHLRHTYSWLFTKWYHIMIKKKVNSDYIIFTDSHFSKDDIVSYYGVNQDKVVVAYCGTEHILRIEPDDSILDQYNLRNKKYSLFVGSNFEHKNLSFLVEKAEKCPDEYFVFVTKRLPEELPKKNVLYIEENLSLASLKSLYAHADNLYMVSSYEGFGLPPIEAILSGCKHVTLSAIPVFHEIYGDQVDYVPVSKTIVMGKLKDITPEYKNELQERFQWAITAKIIFDTVNNYDIGGNKK